MSDVVSPLLGELRALPRDRIIVEHRPPTARYGRAQAKLGYILDHAEYLGWRRAGERPPEEAVELAAWTQSPRGRGYGYYTCFRVWLEDGAPVAAVLFCFYDGTEKSPGFKAVDAAGAFARDNGFQDDHDGAQDHRTS